MAESKWVARVKPLQVELWAPTYSWSPLTKKKEHYRSYTHFQL